MIRGVVFDMDDTLYLERDYVHSGFRAASDYLAQHQRVDGEEALYFLWNGFLKGIRHQAFDRLIQAFPEALSTVSPMDLVEIYRTHSPDIQLLPEMKTLLDALKDCGIPMALISDGPLSAQQRKVEALGLTQWMDAIVLTDAWGREHWKPHPRAFQAVQDAFGMSGRQILYIGDNPAKDFLAPIALNWSTLLVSYPDRVSQSTNTNLVDGLAHSPSEAHEWVKSNIQDSIQPCTWN